jgi:WD40 repeat protein
VLQGHTDVVNSVAFSPNGSLLASGGDDGEIRLWNTSDGRCTRRIVRLDIMEEISSLSFSPDGKMLVAGGHNIDNDYGAILLWDLSNDDNISPTTLYAEIGEGDDVYAISYSPDGRYIASASGNGLVRLWNTSDGSCKSVLEGHQAPVPSICFSPNGKILASVGEDSCLRLWNVQDASCLLVLSDQIHPRGCILSVTFSPDGQTLVTGGNDQRVCFWNPYEEKNRDKEADWEYICRLWSIRS